MLAQIGDESRIGSDTGFPAERANGSGTQLIDLTLLVTHPIVQVCACHRGAWRTIGNSPSQFTTHALKVGQDGAPILLPLPRHPSDLLQAAAECRKSCESGTHDSYRGTAAGIPAVTRRCSEDFTRILKTTRRLRAWSASVIAGTTIGSL